MLLAEVGVRHRDTHRKQVDSGLITRILHNVLPTSLVAVGMVDNEEVGLGSMQRGTAIKSLGLNTIALLQTPHRRFVTPARRTRGTREKHLRIESVDEGGMQVELRLGMQEMLKPVHAAKVRRKLIIEN